MCFAGAYQSSLIGQCEKVIQGESLALSGAANRTLLGNVIVGWCLRQLSTAEVGTKSWPRPCYRQGD